MQARNLLLALELALIEDSLRDEKGVLWVDEEEEEVELKMHLSVEAEVKWD